MDSVNGIQFFLILTLETDWGGGLITFLKSVSVIYNNEKGD